MHRDWSLLAELFFGLVHLSNEVDKPFARLGNSLQNPKNIRSNILYFTVDCLGSLFGLLCNQYQLECAKA